MIRRTAIAVWVCVVLAGLVSYLVWPETFDAQNIADLLARFQNEVLILYLTVSMLRGITLLPSTPLIVAGTLLFPTQPWLVLVVSIVGILVSSTMIYWLSDVLGISEFFEIRKPKAVAKIRGRLEHPSGIAFVALWALFPLVPTDAVCYVAGSIRMNFAKFILAIFAGELILCSVYIFSGSYLIDKLT